MFGCEHPFGTKKHFNFHLFPLCFSWAEKINDMKVVSEVNLSNIDQNLTIFFSMLLYFCKLCTNIYLNIFSETIRKRRSQ